jgi:hypothetical protein
MAILSKGKARQRITFDEYMVALRIYRAKHGNLNVPTKKHMLSIFVSEVRRCGRELFQGKVPSNKSKLNEQRIAKLNEMGFPWNFVKELDPSVYTTVMG